MNKLEIKYKEFINEIIDFHDELVYKLLEESERQDVELYRDCYRCGSCKECEGWGHYWYETLEHLNKHIQLESEDLDDLKHAIERHAEDVAECLIKEWDEETKRREEQEKEPWK